jgi:hypothetical protein
MPGGDRTGPWGMGPMTGRGMGFCGGYGHPGYINPAGFGWGFGAGRGGIPWGGGRGRAFGGGRGWAWRSYAWGGPQAGYYGYGTYAPEPYYPGPWGGYGYQPNPNDEKVYLENQLQALQEQIGFIQQRIEELSQSEGSEEKAQGEE